jgi:hypothetical protein
VTNEAINETIDRALNQIAAAVAVALRAAPLLLFLAGRIVETVTGALAVAAGVYLIQMSPWQLGDGPVVFALVGPQLLGLALAAAGATSVEAAVLRSLNGWHRAVNTRAHEIVAEHHRSVARSTGDPVDSTEGW